MRRLFALLRLGAAAVGVMALYSHLVYSLGSGASALPNFFSYFTMQSAMAAVVLWSIGGVIALRRAVDPSWLVVVRGLITTYQLVSGVVYTVIVAESVSLGIAIHVPVSSQILHYWLPAFALLDWVTAPGRPRVRWRMLAVVLVFPLAWGGFTMVRGAVVGWYPYFFLDPYQVSGPGEFAIYSVIVLAFIALVAGGLIAVSAHLPPSVRAMSGSNDPRVGSSGVDERSQGDAGELADVVVGHAGQRGGVSGSDQPH